MALGRQVPAKHPLPHTVQVSEAKVQGFRLAGHYGISLSIRGIMPCGSALQHPETAASLVIAVSHPINPIPPGRRRHLFRQAACRFEIEFHALHANADFLHHAFHMPLVHQPLLRTRPDWHGWLYRFAERISFARASALSVSSFRPVFLYRSAIFSNKVATSG